MKTMLKSWKRFATLAVVLAGVTLMTASPAYAVIVVLNGSFEAPIPMGGSNTSYDFGPITSWTDIGHPLSHVRVGNHPAFFNYAAAVDGTTKYSAQADPDGSGGGFGGIYQDIGTMAAGEVYTFNGTVFAPDAGATITMSYRVSLIDATTSTTLGFIDQTDFAPAPGGTLPASFSVNAVAGNTLRLQIETLTFSPSGTNYRTGFDALSVATTAAEPVPEPSTLVLAALGLAGLGVIVWRRRK